MTSECPICFDVINATNQTITECGHAFHTNCLMKNVLHNGVGCPYCRTAMCEEPQSLEEDDDEEDDDEDYTEDDEDDIETEDEEDIQDWLVQERIQRTEERAFANLRRLFTENEEEEDTNAPNQENNNETNVVTESSEDDEEDSGSSRIDSGRERPTTDYITDRLRARGITMGHLVKLMLAGEYPLYDDIMTRGNYRRDTRNLHDHLRDIINNYDAEEEYDTDSEEEQTHQAPIIDAQLTGEGGQGSEGGWWGQRIAPWGVNGNATSRQDAVQIIALD